MRSLLISLLVVLLAAAIQAEVFKKEKVKLGKKTCLCDFNIEIGNPCSGSAKCDKKCSGSGSVELGGCSFTLAVKKGKGKISKCSCESATVVVPTEPTTGSGSGETPVPITGSGSGETPVPITGSGSGETPVPITGSGSGGPPPPGGEGMQCSCKCNCPDGSGECDCDCNCPMTSKALTCAPGFSKVCPMMGDMCPQDMDPVCPYNAMSRMAGSATYEGMDKGCQCVPDFLLDMVMIQPSTRMEAVDRAMTKATIQVGKKKCKCSYEMDAENCKKSKIVCDKKCSGKATDVELADGDVMYVVDIAIKKGKVTIAKCDFDAPEPTGTGGGSTGSGSGNGGGGVEGMRSRCACVSKGMGGSGPTIPTLPPTGSGSEPAPPTGSGSGPLPPTGSGSEPPTGSGSGSGADSNTIYQALVKNITQIEMGKSSGYSNYRMMIYVGPSHSNSLVPIIQDEEGYVHVTAGTYGKGKFLVFPWIENYLGPAPSDCIYNWKFNGVAYQGCANPDSDTRDWCPISLGTDEEYVPGSGQYRYCYEGDKYADGMKLLANAFEWMSGTSSAESRKVASYPEILNPSEFPKIEKVEPSKLADVDVYIIGGFGSWSTNDVIILEAYLRRGGTIILGSADVSSVSSSKNRKPMRDFLIKLGLFDKMGSSTEKTVDTTEVPVADDVFIAAVRSILLEGHIPLDVDIKVGQFMKEKLPQIWPESLRESWAYKEILAPGFVKFIEDPSGYEVHLPEYGSYFQHFFLPYMIQDIPTDSPFPKIILPTKYPPQVNSSTGANKSITIPNPNLPVSPKCASCLWVTRYSSIRSSGRRWVSTGLYAKQGELVTVTVPTQLIGKFGIQVGTHTDDLLDKNLDRWLKGDFKSCKRAAQVTQFYEDAIIEEKTFIMTPYGGLIYLVMDDYNDIGEINLSFNNIIESPRFIQGASSNDDWNTSYKFSSAPMIELEVPGIIFTIPRSTIDELNPNMETLAAQWKTIMEAFFELQGYVNSVPVRYATDVEITVGAAHAGYPIMDVPLETYLFDLSGKSETLTSGEATGCYHEIGHVIQDKRWTLWRLIEVTNDIFTEYINEKLYKRQPLTVNHGYTEKFRKSGRDFSSLDKKGLIHIFFLVKDKCGWETYKKFFKYFQDEVPDTLSPNTDENTYSTTAKVLSQMCNMNLVPFFQWWNWPVMNDTLEEAKDLPRWDGIIELLEVAVEECNGGDSCCTAERPCGESEGDCDRDAHCKAGLRCGTDNCPQVTMGTFTLGDDCCYREECNGGNSCCSPERPCAEGEGDCDIDSDCEEGLTCGSNNCPQSIASFESDDDCCSKN